MKRSHISLLTLCLWHAALAAQAQTGDPDTAAIAASDARIVAWAVGWTNYLHGTELDADWMDPTQAVGPSSTNSLPEYDVVSLGNGGQLTLLFDPPIVNGPGPDFAVFGNSLWPDLFLELAYVEVSSNGEDFFRFPNTSLTPDPVDFWDAAMDPTLIEGLAGKYPVTYGVPFDLSDLPSGTALDPDRVPFVRLVDIVGDGTQLDSQGHPIYDPTPTEGSAGFDLEAIGVLNQHGPLHDWRLLHFGAAAAAPAAANHVSWTDDGIPNWLKFALDASPTQTLASLPAQFDLAPTATGPRFRVSYTQRADLPDDALAFEVNTHLVAGEWTPLPVQITRSDADVPAGMVRIHAVAEAPLQAQEFIRVKGVPSP
jgi:hypothetical protein